MVLSLIRGERLMPELMTEIVSGEPYQYCSLGDYVVRAVGVCGGRPTFKYTRIEITGTLERLAAGEHIEDIVQGYRGRVSRAAIMEAVRLVTEQFLKTLPELEPARRCDDLPIISVITPGTPCMEKSKCLPSEGNIWVHCMP
jgi:uncharacterized protein (DUF433 family)